MLDLLLPTSCFACRQPLGPVQRLGACPSCWAGLRPIPPPCCPACGSPVPPGTDLLGPAAGRCARCVLDPLPVGATRAAVVYDRLARRFVLRAKLGGRKEILSPLGALLARAVAGGFADGCTIVIPVPSHPWTRLRRGFNPALEVARPVARALSLPLGAALVRRRLDRPRPAKGLTRAGRREAARLAFVAHRSVRGRTVLLVDDVLTTGATASACAGALLGEGAAEVRLAVWARVIRRF